MKRYTTPPIKTQEDAIREFKAFVARLEEPPNKMPKRKKNEGIWSYLMRISK